MKFMKFSFNRVFSMTRLRQKLLLSYFVLIVLPLCLFTVLSYSRVYSVVESMLQYSAQQSFNQAEAFISKEFRYAAEVSDTIIMHSIIKQISSLFNTHNDVFNQMGGINELYAVQNSFSSFKDIYRIRYYVSEDFLFADEDNFLSLNNVKDLTWYKDLVQRNVSWVLFLNKDMVTAQEPTISYVRFITDPNDYQKINGILRIDIREMSIRKILTQTSSTPNSISYILGPQNKVFSSSTQDIKEEWRLSYTSLLKTMDGKSISFTTCTLGTGKVLLGSRKIADTNLLLITVIPYDEILKASNNIRNDMFVLLLLVSVTAGIFAFIISNSIVKRRTYELKALQGQINPHFLYNTLDLINWTAVNNQVPEISFLVKSLSRFYKLSLSKGSDIIPIKDELEHVRLYVEIQNKRLEGTINLIMDIDEKVYEYSTIKIILQPIVENAILHGIMEKESKTGNIVISACMERNKILFTLYDDGAGMSREQLENVLQYNTKAFHGYGVKNINERIKLYYGNSYGLSYQSAPDAGTTVVVSIPAIHNSDNS